MRLLSDYRSDIADIWATEVSERNITVNGMKQWSSLNLECW